MEDGATDGAASAGSGYEMRAYRGDLLILLDVDLHVVQLARVLVNHLGDHRLEPSARPARGTGVDHRHQPLTLMVKLPAHCPTHTPTRPQP